MKTSILNQNGISLQVTELIRRLVSLIPWPQRRAAMGDAALSLLDGKPRVAEDVFGWNRGVVELGMREFMSGIVCINDISNRRRLKAEEKSPQLLADIMEIMNPHSQAESHLRTTLLYTNLTPKAVYGALLEKGWRQDELPTMQTIANMLDRHGYRLRIVEKTKVQKKRRKPTLYSRTSGA